MNRLAAHAVSVVVASGLVLAAPVSSLQQPSPPGSRSDVYHVHFTKAAPGQAAALGKALIVPDASAPMPDHFMVFRHQEGDSWDFAVIQHLGQKAEVTAAPAAPAAGRDLRAWHNDTFASGPAWPEFTRAMGVGGGTEAAGMVYILGVHRAAAGHRDQLEKLLMQSPPGAKVQTGTVLLQHLEGGDWNFLTITRYNSWEDLAADRAAAALDPSAPGGWAELRQHSEMHRDTIADRLYPAKP